MSGTVILMDVDLVIFGLDLALNIYYMLWPDRLKKNKKADARHFAVITVLAAIALVAFAGHPWAAAVFGADTATNAYLLWKARKA